MIEIKGLVELIIVVLIMKLIVGQWYPPVQKSVQAIFCICIGTSIGYMVNPTKEGLITGIIGSGFAFYGDELIAAFKGVAADAEDLKTINREKGSK